MIKRKSRVAAADQHLIRIERFPIDDEFFIFVVLRARCSLRATDENMFMFQDNTGSLHQFEEGMFDLCGTRPVFLLFFFPTRFEAKRKQR